MVPDQLTVYSDAKRSRHRPGERQRNDHSDYARKFDYPEIVMNEASPAKGTAGRSMGRVARDFHLAPGKPVILEFEVQPQASSEGVPSFEKHSNMSRSSFPLCSARAFGSEGTHSRTTSPAVPRPKQDLCRPQALDTPTPNAPGQTRRSLSLPTRKVFPRRALALKSKPSWNRRLALIKKRSSSAAKRVEALATGKATWPAKTSNSSLLRSAVDSRRSLFGLIVSPVTIPRSRFRLARPAWKQQVRSA